MICPLTKMYTLGSGFIPSANHAGGLRFHGMSSTLSQLYHDGYMEARAVEQTAGRAQMYIYTKKRQKTGCIRVKSPFLPPYLSHAASEKLLFMQAQNFHMKMPILKPLKFQPFFLHSCFRLSSFRCFGVSCIEAFPSTFVKSGLRYTKLTPNFRIFRVNIHFNTP